MPDQQKLPYVLIHQSETSDDVPPEHDTPDARVVFLTTAERDAVQAQLAITDTILTDAVDDRNTYLYLLPAAQPGGLAEAMAFLHELLPPLDEDDEGETTDLLMRLDEAGLTAAVRTVGDRQVGLPFEGDDEAQVKPLSHSEEAGCGITEVLVRELNGKPVVVVTDGTTDNTPSYYDQQAREWLPYFKQ